MPIESFLTCWMRYLCRRHLNFQRGSCPTPPRPHQDRRYLLYIHVPFCEELCPYCSFSRIPFRPTLAARYFRSLEEEIRIYRDLGFGFESVYVGGGTPTVLPDELAGVLRLIRRTWPIKRISVETNPNHLTREVVGVLKEAGVNRLSVGVQTFDDDLLAGIGRFDRYGSGSEIKERLSAVGGVFDTLNIDMIFNLPAQTLAQLLADLEVIKEGKADQVTFYPLMLSRTTGDKFRARCGKISYRKERRFFKRIVEELSDLYRPASAWCFTRADGMIDEYIVDYEEYAGLGAGSFGYLDGAVYSNTFSIPEYMDSVRKGLLPISAGRHFSKTERIQYDLLIRLFGGSLDLERMTEKYGRSFRLRIWKELLFFLATRAVILRGNRLLLTPRGRYYLVVLMREFFSGVNNFREMAAPGVGPPVFER